MVTLPPKPAVDDETMPLTITEWKAAQLTGGGLERLLALVNTQRIANHTTHIWISIANQEQIESQWEKLEGLKGSGRSLPLYGVPFAVKDNIDVDGFITTAACPAFSTAPAPSDAIVVANLKAAGAIVVGKTNLDQFATGLVGTRTPYGAVVNAFDPSRVSGGSSSGSAVAVASGAVPFALGTDTAGSGRVPAGLNNIVGLKPTRGALSARGVVPACRTLDCVSILTLNVKDAETVLSVVEVYDVKDCYSRRRPDPSLTWAATGFGAEGRRPKPLLAICAEPDWFGRDDHFPAYDKALEKARLLGWELVSVNFSPLFQLAQLLYAGPWIAERYEAIRVVLESVDPEEMDPVVRAIIAKAEHFSAADAFSAEYIRQDLTRQIELALERFDGILVPTTPTYPTIQELSQKPIEENSILGTYTNFVNFMDWSAVSVPAGFRPDDLPFGITLISNHWKEPELLGWARQWFGNDPRTLGATGVLHKEENVTNSHMATAYIPIAVAGAHLSGFPLNDELVTRGAVLVKTTKTSPRYKLFVLNPLQHMPMKPGLWRVPSTEEGRKIEVEVWNLPQSALANFMATVPSPMAIGKIELEDNSWVQSFVCEPVGFVGAVDITNYGGWRTYSQHVDTQSMTPPRVLKSTVSTVLVANRGEIAVRIIKTVQKMGLRAVAIFSEADAKSPHVRDADATLKLIGSSVLETYGNISQIMKLAKLISVDAVIPGYGFLSENAKFASAVEDAGMVWVGPTPTQITELGLKHRARVMATKANVPTVPGCDRLLMSLEDALAEGQKLGFPLMLKSTAGGGGIGLSHCRSVEDLKLAFESVQRQAAANFGNGGVFLERFVERARHIEVQILGDGTGRVIEVGERDCSLQRRHQKVIEESPAGMVPETVRAAMKAAAVRLASSVKYRNIGTVEFIYDMDTAEYYFIEVNTRLQVEHPVTELVTNLDLVECMLKIAQGNAEHLFDPSYNAITLSGASIEVRLYAESPLQGFRPCSGQISEMNFPSYLRVDTWVEVGTDVTTLYDPLIAKIIARGPDRRHTLQKLCEGLMAIRIKGVQTNLEYLRQIITSSMFNTGNFTTKSLDTFQYISPSIEVLDPGPLSTIQDYPGRTGYWSVGIPPSGPMDNYSFRIGNRLARNPPDAAGIECTLHGPSLKFYCDTAVAITGGEATITIDGKRVYPWQPIEVCAGQVLSVGPVERGSRVYISIHGGIQVPIVMGSRSTFEMGKLGGLQGRKLQHRDILPIVGPEDDWFVKSAALDYVISPRPPSPIPRQNPSEWVVRVLPGPHDLDYLTFKGLTNLFFGKWKVHHNSNRLGVRLTGPTPEWARLNGGQAGLHPSNVHDSPYSIGSVSFTGDEAVILTNDGPSLGGFVVFCVVVTADMWKLGQVRPGDVIHFDPIDPKTAIELVKEFDYAIETLEPLKDATIPERSEELLEKRLLKPSYFGPKFGNEELTACLRITGDRAFLLDFGKEGEFSLRVSFWIFAFCQAHQHKPIPGVLELTTGVHTLHLLFEAGATSRAYTVLEHMSSLSLPKEVPSRTWRLPLAFDDSVCQAAVQRYTATIRKDAPWLPSNTHFLENLNGLDDITYIFFDATFLVIGLGDVFMGSPCAIPLDPRHRLFGTKYNPSRSFTPRGAVGIGGQYLCIYATDSPGGYQMVGRTVDIWDSGAVTESARPKNGTALGDDASGAMAMPWMFRHFDRITFYPVSEADLDNKPMQDLVSVKDGTINLAEYETWLEEKMADINATTARRAQAIANAPFIDELLNPYQQSESLGTGSAAFEAAYSEIEGERIKAMMPGRCYKVVIKEGASVNKNDVLICIESSKIEMEIRSPVSGRCAAVLVRPGDVVEVGEDLVIIQ